MISSYGFGGAGAAVCRLRNDSSGEKGWRHHSAEPSRRFSGRLLTTVLQEDFGDFSVPVTVKLENGDMGAANFVVSQANEGPDGPTPQSIAEVVAARTIPEPSPALLLVVGLLGAGLIRRKQRA